MLRDCRLHLIIRERHLEDNTTTQELALFECYTAIVVKFLKSDLVRWDGRTVYTSFESASNDRVEKELKTRYRGCFIGAAVSTG